ncbi:MAG: tRNA lysidine(34) synthetase TilS [Rhodocyclaceae bacterium]|nr:tRNA lysidine(34) synthetase TilS [Rhodocyclaceae bacterium]
MASSRKCPSIDTPAAALDGCLTRHVRVGDRLVVGLSGGIDSVVLLFALRSLDFPLSALHVHHGLSKNADQWEAFCRDLCRSWDIPLAVERVAVERDSSDGIEAAARRARHAVFGQASGTTGDWILLAHHRGDQAETLLFNLLRGAGVRGASAMNERNGRLLRPFLSIGRAQIAAFAEAHSLSWIEDESNADVRFSRNWLRHRILPELARRFPSAEARLAAAARRFAEAQALLEDLAEMDLGDAPRDFPVALDRLKSLPDPRARNLLRYLFARRGIGVPSEERLAEALRQCLEARPDRHPSIVFGEWRLVRRRGQIVLERC